mmetsp:Transcript_27142/g.40159  ORF Transcript_27142/g.40159 Transcript_27142/m.40159 type:complete len:729 (+) Transcript_27142:218-2404(+)|eukprot:CAMPEP_0195529614 /NCGR_PEP_ID=MMETSP0794_2-20130614/32221_1 /TAXON_ID=515487 /ORGANISM="Stephanopyxis turris, Strain CCMP 815" /LENGTH=728 /DNA_ID=CAMNT_0040660945 /DNA_START=211 /DNA_END=2397 /DNA_ORIENTATION=+
MAPPSTNDGSINTDGAAGKTIFLKKKTATTISFSSSPMFDAAVGSNCSTTNLSEVSSGGVIGATLGMTPATDDNNPTNRTPRCSWKKNPKDGISVLTKPLNGKNGISRSNSGSSENSFSPPPQAPTETDIVPSTTYCTDSIRTGTHTDLGDELGQSQQQAPRTSSQPDVIDPALLSALRDPRERRNLLRLEQLLVDFMNENNRGFIEVGGAGVGLQYPPKIQTSFQRLCLHRLADRFEIVRESCNVAPNAGTESLHGVTQFSHPMGVNLNMNTVGVNSPNTSAGMTPIRLVKTRDSHIPNQLLIDLNTSPAASNYGDEQPASNGGVANLAESLSSISFDGKGKLVGGQSSGGNKKKIIMKRRDGSKGGGLGNSGKKERERNDKRSLRGKNLGDKEKAYAEARARIFAETAASASGTEGSESGTAASRQVGSFSDKGTYSSGSALSSAHNSSNSLFQDDSGGPSLNPTETPLAELNLDSVDEAPPTSSFALDCNANVTVTKKDISGSYSSTSAVGAPTANKATSGSGVSKVTWRNRKQEENDPDFRRRRGSRSTIQHYAPVVSASHPMYDLNTHTAGVNVQDSSSFHIQQQRIHPGASGTSSGVALSVGYSQQPQIFYAPAPSSGGSHAYNSTMASPSRTQGSSVAYGMSQQGGSSQQSHGNTQAAYYVQQPIYYQQEHQESHQSSAHQGGPVGVYVPSSGNHHGVTFSHRNDGGAGSNIYNSEFPALG